MAWRAFLYQCEFHTMPRTIHAFRNKRTGMTRSLLFALFQVVAIFFLSSTFSAQGHVMSQVKTKKLAIVLFPGFETLDVFGPVEMWGDLDDYEVVTVSQHGGPVKSAQGIETIARYAFEDAPQFQIVMIPGGMGTRAEVNNPAMLDFLRRQDQGTEWTISVCTGSAVLAKAGILAGRRATSNKLAWKFATSQASNVLWQGHARWVVDGKYITSSGVSAGTDMALGLIEKLYGRARAESIARGAEYVWRDDPSNDPYAVEDAGTR